MLESTLRLFKAIPVKAVVESDYAINTALGIMYPKSVLTDYNSDGLEKSIKDILLSNDKVNKTFHKSWNKVATASMAQLRAEQILHYITTYGFEALGIYNENYVYLPKEKSDIPDVEDLKFLYVKAISFVELKNRTLGLLGAGVALKSETIADCLVILKAVGFTQEDFSKVNNKEAFAMLIDQFNILPKDPVEFLRYIMYKTTGEALLLKSKRTFDKLKESVYPGISELFSKYESLYGLKSLSEIFLRFKPIFLGLKTSIGAPTVNKIRKLAIKNHKPMTPAPLNGVTAQIKRGETITNFDDILKTGKVFQKIRLAYALKFRTLDATSIMYKVRNGRSYVDDFNFENKDEANHYLDLTLRSIAQSLNVEGKKIFVPDNINYALPATEKQFVGMFPAGTRINIDDNCVVGVYWKNVDGHRIDLDLSAQNLHSKVGWNRYQRSNDRDVLFSGDMTDAPHGATELIYFRNDIDKAYSIAVNYFNASYGDAPEVPFDILIARHDGKLTENYMVKPKDLICAIPSIITHEGKQKTLGFYTCEKGKSSFLMMDNAILNTNVSATGGLQDKIFNFQKISMDNIISLSDMLKDSGATIVVDPKYADIDLSPDALAKDTFLKMLQS
jgi:hypothetical protein